MESVALPPPSATGAHSLEQTLLQRRSVRSFAPDPLGLTEVSQLLWASQGVTGSNNERTAPSAGATFPIELYIVAASVKGLSPGVWKYIPLRHSLEPVHGLERVVADPGGYTDVRPLLVSATGGQDFLGTVPLVIVAAAVRARTRALYGERAVRYVDMEAGAVLQNAALQGVALGLGSVVIGAFKDEEVGAILGAKAPERVLAMLAVGWPGG